MIDRRDFLGSAAIGGVGAILGHADKLAAEGPSIAVPRPSIDLMSFGAVGDGTTDDTAAVQAAVDAMGVTGGAVTLPSGVFRIEGTVRLPSNIRFEGEPGATFRGIVTPEGRGAYPNQMFRNADWENGNSGISFRNIHFDFGKLGFNYVATEGATTVNGLRFVRTRDLRFDDCTFTDFVTNLDTSLSGKPILAFGMAFFDSCENVSFNRLRTARIREEGFNFYDCEHVSFEGWDADGSGVDTSSHAGFWYCDGVTVRNARMVHTGGSVLNCFSRNVWFENIRVNDGRAMDGRGFDFGNEIDVKSFDIGNINVVGCTLNVFTYGVLMQPSEHADACESINIQNNRFYVAPERDETIYGLRLLGPRAATVQGNLIELGEVTSAESGRCIHVSLVPSPISPDGASTLRIVGNVMRGLCGIGMRENANSALGGLYIAENDFRAQDKGSLSAYAGAGTFLYVRNNAAAAGSGTCALSDVHVQGNTARNLAGGAVVMALDAPERMAMSRWRITGNHFAGPPGTMERGFVLGGRGVQGTADVRFANNTIEDCGPFILAGLKRAVLEGNVWSWSGSPTTNRVTVSGHDGTFEFAQNRFFSTDSGSGNHLHMGDDGSRYSLLRVVGNASIDGDGTLSFRTNMPQGTRLPGT